MVGPCGGVSIMEHTVHCADRFTVKERFDCLTDAYTCLQTGSCPSRGAADVVAVMFSEVCGLPSVDGERASAGHCCDSSTELTYISVTLVEKITSTLTSQSLSPAVELYFMEILRMLFQDMDLMSHLVHQFQSEDQILSHLAAKSVTTCVLYHLTKSSAVSPVWEQKCVQAFHCSPPGAELDACLWSVTDLLKRLLKGAHQEILGKLLASLDSSLSALCSRFLPEEGNESVRCWMDCTGSTHWGTTFCLLLDLLEVLTASSLVRGAGVSVKSQSLTHRHSAGLLTVVSRSSECFVKKRVLLLLKRTVLQKAGEDWSLDVLFTATKYEHFNSDMGRLAQSVLAAVAANWLQSVEVDSASFFGGTTNVREDEDQKPNCVMLRAVSLLLLKSMELHIQTTAGACSATEVHGYLQSLLGFLKRHSVQLMELTHLCSWVGLLFGEQDDDMMEAAKALLSIFLCQRKYSGFDDLAVSEAACSSGCNPHCHFLLLLRSICFDHSILLDFLISTETCFLEYFVRYLKYLRADWHGFRAACGRISVSGSPVPQQKSLSTSYAGHMFTPTREDEPDGVKSSCCVQPACSVSPSEMEGVAAGLRLVEYDSSDESDPESRNERGTSVGEKSELSALNGKQMSGAAVPIGYFDSSDSTGLLSNYTLGGRPKGASLPASQRPNMAALSEHVTCQTSARAVRCLSELREAVTRLHTKKLFPYDPSSLLKLLAQ